MYTITIEKTIQRKAIEQGRYQTIEERPYTQEELKESGHPECFKDQLKKINGYPPDREVLETVKHEIYTQKIETLDLNKVICAINGIGQFNNNENDE